MGMTKEEHLHAALQLSETGFPLDTTDFADTDIKCAAACIAENAGRLRARLGAVPRNLILF